MTDDPALRIYAQHASALNARWQAAYAPEDLFAPVIDLLPAPPCRIADIGAGPGREAAWLASLGHQVTAVEPVAEFRDLGQARNTPGLTWLDDRLPDLSLLRQGPPQDLVLLSGVWHHVDPAMRENAMGSLAAVLRSGGSVMMSLRQGPTDPRRGLYPADAEEAIQLAQGAGLSQQARRPAPAIQQQNRDAGVSWIWLMLAKQT